MKLSLRAKTEPEVNLTSLIDVVLLLLIFFMVSTSFVKESQISITLPEAESEAGAVDDPAVEVSPEPVGSEPMVGARRLVQPLQGDVLLERVVRCQQLGPHPRHDQEEEPDHREHAERVLEQATPEPAPRGIRLGLARSILVGFRDVTDLVGQVSGVGIGVRAHFDSLTFGLRNP